MKHLNITSDTVPKKQKNHLSQKHQQRLSICQNKGHSSSPSKWTNYRWITLHSPNMTVMDPRHTVQLLLIVA